MSLARPRWQSLPNIVSQPPQHQHVVASNPARASPVSARAVVSDEKTDPDPFAGGEEEGEGAPFLPPLRHRSTGQLPSSSTNRVVPIVVSQPQSNDTPRGSSQEQSSGRGLRVGVASQDGDPFTISSARSDRYGSYPSAPPLVSHSISSEELTPGSTPRGVPSPSQLSIITSIDDDSSDTMSGLRGWLPPLGHRPHPPPSSTPSSTSSFSRASTATWTLQSTTNSLVSSSDDRFADLEVDNPINFPLQKQNAQQAAMTITQDFGIEADLLILNKVKSCQVNRSPLVPGQYRHLLPPVTDLASKRITLVLDLDETLIHASSRFRREVKHELVIPVKDDNNATVGVAYVAFRPHVQRFLREVAQLFEVVAFTSSLPDYADPILDALDPSKKLISHRLYRDHCVEVKGKKVKDLSLLGRPLDRIAIIDNSPAAYLFQPRNAIPIRSWFHDPHDRDLLKLLKLLEHLSTAKKVYPVLDQYNAHLISKLRSS